MGKKVVRTSKDGEETTFDTAAAAAKETGVPHTSLHRHLRRGKEGLLGDWRWRYEEPQEPPVTVKEEGLPEPRHGATSPHGAGEDFFETLKTSDGRIITSVRPSDGYINATKMCQSAGKGWGNYWANAATEAFVKTLSSRTKIAEFSNKPIFLGDPTDYALVHTTRGGLASLQGTWVHPLVATHLAQWCSTEFSVKVAEWMEGFKSKDRGFKRTYEEAIENIRPDKKRKTLEKTVKESLHRRVGGDMEVPCDHGKIDILTDDTVIEVKRLEKYVHALGQVLSYSISFPHLEKRIHLFGEEDEGGPTVRNAQRLYSSFGVMCTYERIQ